MSNLTSLHKLHFSLHACLYNIPFRNCLSLSSFYRLLYKSFLWKTRANYVTVSNLKIRVQDLLIDLIKREFPKLKADVSNRLSELNYLRDDMGASRGDGNSQRSYLSRMSESFQDRTRDALNADYTRDKLFVDRHDLRLITRVVETSEKFNQCIERSGHTWCFMEEASDSDNVTGEAVTKGLDQPSGLTDFTPFLDLGKTKLLLGKLKDSRPGPDADHKVEYPQLDDLLNIEVSSFDMHEGAHDIMEYIEKVYKSSRGQELGIVSS